MKTVALISGGKDSCFNMMHCVAAGHQLVALANLRPEDKGKPQISMLRFMSTNTFKYLQMN